MSSYLYNKLYLLYPSIIPQKWPHETATPYTKHVLSFIGNIVATICLGNWIFISHVFVLHLFLYQGIKNGCQISIKISSLFRAINRLGKNEDSVELSGLPHPPLFSQGQRYILKSVKVNRELPNCVYIPKICP